MSLFPSAAHLSSWAGLCPGNRRSAGKDKGGRRTRGNRWLRATLRSELGGIIKKGLLPERQVLALAAQGKKRAVVAVAHTLLVLIYQVLGQAKPYQERETPVLQERQRRRLIRHHVRSLGRLGINVGFSPQRGKV